MKKYVCMKSFKRMLLQLIQKKRIFNPFIKRNSFAFRIYGIGLLALFFFSFYMKYARENMSEILTGRAFSPEFTGASVCGHFSCFGLGLCDIQNVKLFHINETLITGTKDWIKIPGMIRDRYRKEQEVVLNFPNVKYCRSASCKIELNQELFSSTNYQNWICHNYGYKSGCNVIEILHDWPQMKLFLLDAGRLNPNIIKGLSPPLHCPSPRLADRLVRRILGAHGKGSTSLSDYSYQEKAEFIFTCKMSPETVMQKLFPPYEGWLLHHAVGVCGLMTMNRFSVRTTLYQLYEAPWKTRLDVAVQLLDLARFYTENDSKFLLLIHRLTPHDLGVSKTGKLRVENSENIILVDTAASEKSKYHETTYHREIFHVSEDRICSYKRTDINYYTVCRYFLTGSWKGSNGKTLRGGLLHDPDEHSAFTRKMLILLDLCVRGSVALTQDELMPGVPVREAAAGQLRQILDSARECRPKFAYRYPECELIGSLESRYRLPDLEIKRML